MLRVRYMHRIVNVSTEKDALPSSKATSVLYKKSDKSFYDHISLLGLCYSTKIIVAID